ncbi:hypothetical protein BKA70DRAFT_1433811 [Coprinopsis sp. MPI-PUGE-AT-0042]|nr:hypothetical protein BKA70DRAFT_1433811 [Coprinopsis sp. MPI-PUGE-AT-0042]
MPSLSVSIDRTLGDLEIKVTVTYVLQGQGHDLQDSLKEIPKELKSRLALDKKVLFSVASEHTRTTAGDRRANHNHADLDWIIRRHGLQFERLANLDINNPAAYATRKDPVAKINNPILLTKIRVSVVWSKPPSPVIGCGLFIDIADRVAVRSRFTFGSLFPVPPVDRRQVLWRHILSAMDCTRNLEMWEKAVPECTKPGQ